MINVKLSFFHPMVGVQSLILTDAPSLEQVREDIETQGGMIIVLEEATAEEVAAATPLEDE